MDHATQQNASLVKEMAAAADGLKNQVQELAQARLPAVSKAKVPANNEDDRTSF